MKLVNNPFAAARMRNANTLRKLNFRKPAPRIPQVNPEEVYRTDSLGYGRTTRHSDFELCPSVK